MKVLMEHTLGKQDDAATFLLMPQMTFSQTLPDLLCSTFKK